MQVLAFWYCSFIQRNKEVSETKNHEPVQSPTAACCFIKAARSHTQTSCKALRNLHTEPSNLPSELSKKDFPTETVQNFLPRIQNPSGFYSLPLTQPGVQTHPKTFPCVQDPALQAGKPAHTSTLTLASCRSFRTFQWLKIC